PGNRSGRESKIPDGFRERRREMSRRNRLTLAEQETIILWDNELDTANVYTHDQRIANKLKELEKKYPDQFRLKEKGAHRSVTYEVPKRCVNIRPPYNEARRQQQIKNAAESGTLFQTEDEHENSEMG
ncbi:MAG: hypothetical protein IKM73_12485, partial [Acidaminococcaceae bacterium]|nr:hypothetical protein [Acidaminococcaceae bacterium]